MFDILFKNARILDGTGNPWFYGDVGVRAGQIAAVGKLDAAADTVIDVGEKFLAPGFIDAHIHTDVVLLADPIHEAGLRQGVTTHIIGQDGISFAPVSKATMEYMRAYFAAINTVPDIGWDWSSVTEYLDRFDGRVGANVAYLIPHGNLRLEAMGLANRRPTADELAHMQRLAGQAMQEGAVGFSTGLDYIPCPYADTEELIAIARAVALYGGVYVTHQRSYAPDSVAEATRESLHIGEEGSVAVHISHFNGRADVLLPLIDEGRQRGIDVTYDTYCYLASCTILAMSALPQWVQEGGPWETEGRLRQPEVRNRLRPWLDAPERRLAHLQLSYVPGHPDEEGLLIPDAAQRAGLSPADYVCDRLADTHVSVCALGYHAGLRTEADMVAIMQHPAHMVGSDGIFSGSRPHPRGYGCFARYLAYHTRERGDFTWEEAVRHMTSHAARRFHLTDRGQVHAGFAADLVVFDPDRIQDTATFENGAQFAEGVDHVLVNGTFALRDGEATGALAGRALRYRN